MKIFYFITLSFFFVVSSFAATQNCVDNFNKSIRLYDEGRSLFIEARENYEAFNKLKDMVIRNKGRKRHSKFNRTEKTIEAIELLNQAIAKTREAKEKFRLGNSYNAKAQEYCYDENAAKARQDFDTSQQYLEKIAKRLTGKDPSQATSFIPDYSTAKTDLLNDLIRYRKAQAIYMIENEEIDLNSSSREDGWTPLHTAVSRNDMDITKALVEAGANINRQTRQGYTPLMFATINGNDKLFTYLFEHNASPFLLTGFNADNKYKNCNIADLTTLAGAGQYFEGSEFETYYSLNRHQAILDYLQSKGLIPVCNQNPL
jgi:tetratricopeptide (TPR) repeat protein